MDESNSQQLPSPEHKELHPRILPADDMGKGGKIFCSTVPHIKGTKTPTRYCRICTKIMKSVKPCGFPPPRYVWHEISHTKKKKYYNFQSVPCEMFIQVRRSSESQCRLRPHPPKKDSTINKLSYSRNVTSTLHYFFYIHCRNWGTYHSRVPTFVSPHHRRLPPVCSASFPMLISTPCHPWRSAMLGKLQSGRTSESDTDQVQTVQWMV